MVVGAAVAAALAVTGCAPAGYNAQDYGGGTGGIDPAAAESTAEPTDEPTGEATAEPEATSTAEAPGDSAPKLAEDDITSELTGTKVNKMGRVVVDQEGFVLYRFDKDKAGDKPTSNCYDDCAKIWPPSLTDDGKPTLEGVDAADVGTLTRKDGTKQLTLDGWALYRYAGDKKPGQWKGQNVSGTWFVINPDGTKNLTCMPAVSKPIAPPADDEEKGDEESGSDYSY